MEERATMSCEGRIRPVLFSDYRKHYGMQRQWLHACSAEDYIMVTSKNSLFTTTSYESLKLRSIRRPYFR